MNIDELSRAIGRRLVRRKITVSVCESCTGGMFGSIITRIPGSSKYFSGGVIAYSNDVKKKIVGVKTETLRKYGAVSAEVAKEMARGIQEKLKSDIGIGITGIAGPLGSSKKKPVGLVYIGLSYKKKLFVEKFLLKGNRDQIRKKSCREALMLLCRLLTRKIY